MMTLFPAPKRRAATAFLAFAAAAAACLLPTQPSQAADDRKPSQPKPAMTVTAVRPSSAGLPLQLTANGSIAAWQEASVGTQANGLRLSEVRANVGDEVKAGDLLASFASETVQADVAQARAALLEAQANAAEAASNAERARSVQDSGALSAQQVAQYLTAELSARARVQSAQATLDAQLLRLQQTRVLAPDAGVISSRSASVGAVLPAGAELFRLIRQGRLEWRAEVTAGELGHLKAGQGVRVTAATGMVVTGRVRMVAPTVDPATRTALVYVDLPNATASSAGVKAGMFARGEFELGSSIATTVPQQAVVMRDGFDYVFRLSDGATPTRVQQLKVRTGRRVGERVEILTGLPGDALVVVQGAGFLNDGDLVKVVPATPAAVASTPVR